MAGGRELMLVAYTGYGDVDAARLAAQAGFDLYMKKGCDPILFVELASRLVIADEFRAIAERYRDTEEGAAKPARALALA